MVEAGSAGLVVPMPPLRGSPRGGECCECCGCCGCCGLVGVVASGTSGFLPSVVGCGLSLGIGLYGLGAGRLGSSADATGSPPSSFFESSNWRGMLNRMASEPDAALSSEKGSKLLLAI